MVSPGSNCLLVCSLLLPLLSVTSYSVYTLQPTSSVVLYFVQNWGYIFNSFACIILQPLLPNSHPHLLTVHPVPTNKAMASESQWCNCFIRNGGNAIPKHTCPEATGSKPTTGLTLLWAYNHSGEILTTSNSHTKKPYRLFL